MASAGRKSAGPSRLPSPPLVQLGKLAFECEKAIADQPAMRSHRHDPWMVTIAHLARFGVPIRPDDAREVAYRAKPGQMAATQPPLSTSVCRSPRHDEAAKAAGARSCGLSAGLARWHRDRRRSVHRLTDKARRSFEHSITGMDVTRWQSRFAVFRREAGARPPESLLGDPQQRRRQRALQGAAMFDEGLALMLRS